MVQFSPLLRSSHFRLRNWLNRYDLVAAVAVAAVLAFCPLEGRAVDLSKLGELCESPIVNNAFCVRSARESRVLLHTPSVLARDGGTAARIGPWLVWTWGDTFTKFPAQAPGPRDILSHTLSVSVPSSLAFDILFENLDSGKRPYQTIPYTTAEQNFNECSRADIPRPAYCDTLIPKPARAVCTIPAGATSGTCETDREYSCKKNLECTARIAHWPTLPIETSTSGCETGRTSPTCTGQGDIFYNTMLLINEDKVTWKGTGIARIKESPTAIQTVATRVTTSPENPLYVFKPGGADVGFSPSLVEDGYVYLIGSKKFPDEEFPLRILARVPLGSQHLRNSYTFWDGGQWSGSIGSAVPLGITLGNGSSIFWNIYLKQYVFVSQTLFGGKYLLVQAAPKITGPWSPAQKYFETRPADPSSPYGNYYSEVHPEFSRGINFNVTYYNNIQPNFDIPVVKGKFRKFKSVHVCTSITAPTAVSLGQPFTIKATLRNDSYLTWGKTTHSIIDYYAFRDGAGSAHEYFGVTGTSVPSDVAPNGSVTINIPAKGRVRGASLPLSLVLKNGNEVYNGGCQARITVR